jgi:acyl-CoA synthetase (NDP forming)
MENPTDLRGQLETSRARLSGAELIDLISDPSSIAIAGASATASSYGGRIVGHLRHGYAGEVTLINPNRAEIEGRPCLASPLEIAPDSVDVAMVATGSDTVVEICRQLGDVGVRVVVAIAAGMADSDKQELRRIAETKKLRIIGPNCIGVVARRSATYLSFGRYFVGRPAPAGGIALVTQSGSLGNAMLSWLGARGAGISHWITTGDEADVGALELVAGLLRQPDVRAAGLFLEAMGDVEWLMEVEAAISETGKPVFCVRGARSSAGRSAAAGHTGRVVGSSEASVAALRAAGVIVLPDMAGLSDALVMFDILGKRPKGGRLGIVTISGGSGVLAADVAVDSRAVRMADLSDADPELAALVGGRVHGITNPLDVAASEAPIFAAWANTLATRPSCDVVLAIEASMIHDVDALVAGLAECKDRTRPLVLADFAEGDPLRDDAVLSLAAAGIPVMRDPERAVRAIDALLTDDALIPAPQPVNGAALGDHGTSEHLEGFEAAVELLPRVSWVKHAVVGPSDARARASEIGFPLVVKLAGRAVRHRAEADGVRVGVSAEELDDALASIHRIADANNDAVMLQQQVPGGAEVMVSALQDAEVGPVAFVRPGGMFTELIQGHATIWYRWSKGRRRTALAKSIVGRLLLGYRGGPQYDIEALGDLVDELLGGLELRQFAFVEMNPVFVTTTGVTVVDALIQRPPRGDR